MTRNFNNKAKTHNTTNTLPDLEKTLNYLINGGLKIVNIGFPPKSFDINNSNYTEINDNLTQNELISTIVRVALWVIMGVGIITTGVYVLTLFVGKDTQVISAAWSNIFGILLTNAFSIVGTIMGIKYATENKQ